MIIALQPDDSWDDQGIAQAALAEAYTLAHTQEAAGWQVETYVRSPGEPAAVDATFENGVTLTHAATQEDRLEPGGLLIVYLLWDGDATRLTGSEKLTLQVLDEAGALVAQTTRRSRQTTSTRATTRNHTPSRSHGPCHRGVTSSLPHCMIPSRMAHRASSRRTARIS